MRDNRGSAVINTILLSIVLISSLFILIYFLSRAISSFPWQSSSESASKIDNNDEAIAYKSGEALAQIVKDGYLKCTGYKFFSDCENIECADNEYEQQIYTAWKKYFLILNDYSEKYFDEHVTVTEIDSGNDRFSKSESVGVTYVVNYDWVRFRSRTSLDAGFVFYSDEQISNEAVAGRKYLRRDEDHVRYKNEPISQDKLVKLLDKKYKNLKLDYDFCDIKDAIRGYVSPGRKEPCHYYYGDIDIASGKITYQESECETP